MRFRAVLLSFTFLLAAPRGVLALNLSNFDQPESVAIDPVDGSYYVTNVNGDLFQKDANGYISKITPDGNLVIQRFISSKEGAPLNAPKGLAIAGGTIYVTDIDAVKSYDKETGKPKALIDLSKLGAKFLNDIVADADGRLYVSDTVADLIFRIAPGNGLRASVYKFSGSLGGPNGLAFNPKSKNLMVVTWKSGRIVEIDREGRLHVLKRGLTALDGIDYDAAGNLYVSSFDKGEIYRIPYMGRGTLGTFASGVETPADILYDRKKGEIVVPSMNPGRVLSLADAEAKKFPPKRFQAPEKKKKSSV